MQKYLYSIVVSVYNEEEILSRFHQELVAALNQMDDDFEILFVNDGSKDHSGEILDQIVAKDERVSVIHFSRNFGHEAAMLAGIDNARGDAVICMDSDLQHPPTILRQMVSTHKQGKDVVTMMRTSRADGGFFRHITSHLFYKIINKMADAGLQPGASDFFLISRKVVDVLKVDYRERTRFLRGIIQTIGFEKEALSYDAPMRAAGTSKYSFWKLLRLSFSAIASFSKMPLKIGVYSGTAFVLLSVILAVYSIIMWILNAPVSGFTVVIAILCAIAGVQLVVTGIIGYYIGFIFDEVKRRPLYIVQKINRHGQR